MRIGDSMLSATDNSDNHQNGTEIAWSSSVSDKQEHCAKDNSVDGEWNVSVSPLWSVGKNQKGSTVNSNETSEGSPKETTESTNWKDVVEAVSPIVSAFLSKNKDVRPSANIDVLAPAVEKLTSDAENMINVKNSDQDKTKGKTHRTGDSGVIVAKQTTKSRMLAEINKRRRTRIDDEKKVGKQKKDELSKSTKTSSCTFCGVPMADGMKTICKSCMTRQKRDKSKDKNFRRLPLSLSDLSRSEMKDDIDLVRSPEKEICNTDKSPLEEEALPEENVTRSRSLSLDTVESVDTSKKYGTQKRTNTDLGPNSLFKTTQEKPINDNNQLLHNDCPLKNVGSTGNLAEHTKAVEMKEEANFRNISSGYSDIKDTHLSGMGTRLIKRSTTDSEIVSKSKMNGKSITSKEEQKSTFDNGRQPVVDDWKKRGSPKTEKSDTTTGSHTSHENVIVGMKLERSKTVVGKMNVDGDKKVIDFEKPRHKEGSNISTESEKSYSNKKFTSSGRSHTIIGDGHNKRQKSKGDWSKAKMGKRENSSCSIMKDIKKKVEKKGCISDDDGKKVSFVEGDGEPIKSLEVVEAIESSSIRPSFPKNLYDCEEDSDNSDSEEDSESAPVEKCKASNTQSTTELPKAATLQEIKKSVLSREAEARHSECFNQANIHNSTTDLGNYPREELPRDGEAVEPASIQFSRWQEQNADSIEYDRIIQEEHQILEYEVDLESSYSEHSKRSLEKIEEQSDEEVAKENSDNGLYTNSPKQDGAFHDSEEMDNQYQQTSYFQIPETCENTGSVQRGELYTLHETAQSNIVPKIGNETYYGIATKSESPQAEYADMSLTGLWRRTMLGNGDSAANYFNSYETDVDTGFLVLHPQNEKRTRNAEPGKEWGFGGIEDGDSSSSSGDEDDQVVSSDSWYTGGYYDEPKENTNVDDEDLVYYNDKAGRKMSESDIYTGDLFSSAVAKSNDQTDMSKNNNITLEDSLFEGSNFWIISSRPQMRQMNWNPLSRMKNVDVLMNWVDHQCGNDVIVGNLTLPISNVSNNNNDDDESKPSAATAGLKGMFPVRIASKSDYTEYSSELLASVRSRKPRKEVVLLGNKDFTKYDMVHNEGGFRGDPMSMRNCDSYKTDALFFGDDCPQVSLPNAVKPPTEQGGLYFNKNFKPVMRVDHSPVPVHCHYPKDEDYQGGFSYATQYESNNNNNNDQEGESYTGCFRNEEEYKPSHDGLFNDKASSFVFHKRAPEPVPLYFCNANSKSYYDAEESVYAFERKMEQKTKPKEVPKIMKIGSIVVRNNVECEVDYAQNIDMDSQDVPKTWMRYNYGADANVADTSSYAQNVSFEDFGSAKPWAVEGCRAPWKLTKLSEKKGKEEALAAKHGDGHGSWKAAPDS